jgi:hypothetical protein
MSKRTLHVCGLRCAVCGVRCTVCGCAVCGNGRSKAGEWGAREVPRVLTRLLLSSLLLLLSPSSLPPLAPSFLHAERLYDVVHAFRATQKAYPLCTSVYGGGAGTALTVSETILVTMRGDTHIQRSSASQDYPRRCSLTRHRPRPSMFLTDLPPPPSLALILPRPHSTIT